MDLNKIAIDTIQSDYIKNYIRSINHGFTLREQITIIHNSNLTLEEKLDIYNKYIENSSVEDEPLSDYLKSFYTDLCKLIKTTRNIVNILLGKDINNALVFEEKLTYNNTCTRSLDGIKSYIYRNTPDKASEYNDINICSINTAEIQAYVKLNDNLQPIWYELTDKSYLEKTGLEDSYVRIPNNLKIGDVVTIHGDEDKNEYVVVNESVVPKHLENECDYNIDSSITVVTKELLDQYGNDYKNIIENILINRIHNIDDNTGTMDVLSEYHEHIHITLIEKDIC